jgi:hypothetical protein|eukprot:COSAG01_NODE_1743_length_9354_cov_76.987574_3_plen_88_part_00
MFCVLPPPPAAQSPGHPERFFGASLAGAGLAACHLVPDHAQGGMMKELGERNVELRERIKALKQQQQRSAKTLAFRDQELAKVRPCD